MSQEAASPLLLAAQALPYADEPVEGEEELDEKEKEREKQKKEEEADHRRRECEQEQPRKQSLGQRRNVELPELYVVNELPEELETMRERDRDRDRDIQHFGPGLRRNSISLPQGINSLDLEALRLRHQMLAQESLNEESQAESIVDDASASSIGTPTTISALPIPHVNPHHSKEEEEDDDSSDEFGNAKKPVH
ncbi:hypothetical protein AWZ03_014459, partial [Drosophila navojoa]